MLLEFRSIAFVTAINLLLFALGFFVQWLRERDASLRDWAIGFALGALGAELSARRGALPDLLTVALAGVLLVLIYVYTYLGLCRLFGRRPARAIWLIPLVTGALYLYFMHLVYRPAVWPMITGYARFAICSVIFLQLHHERARMARYGATLLVWSIVVMGLFMLVRATLTPWLTPGDNQTLSGLPAFTYLLTAACTIAMMLGLLSLHMDQLLQRLEDAANTDVLTGLPNRRRFNQLARVEIARSLRCAQPLWLLMIDIDHFKHINDRYGHDEGDHALQLVAKALHATLRSYDLVARYGGEEFCVLLPSSDACAAQASAERMRQLVALLRVGPQRDHAVTISLGAATLCSDTAGLEALLTQADRALYRAKEAGRNRVLGFAPYVVAPA